MWDKTCKIMLNKDSDMSNINDDSDAEPNNNTCMNVDESATDVDRDEPDTNSDI